MTSGFKWMHKTTALCVRSNRHVNINKHVTHPGLTASGKLSFRGDMGVIFMGSNVGTTLHSGQDAWCGCKPMILLLFIPKQTSSKEQWCIKDGPSNLQQPSLWSLGVIGQADQPPMVTTGGMKELWTHIKYELLLATFHLKIYWIKLNETTNFYPNQN